MDTSTLSKRLVLLRMSMGWSSSDRAAREYDLPKETYRSYENGELPEHLKVMFCWRVHERTGVDFGWLFGGDEKIGQQPPAEAAEWLRMEFPRRRRRDQLGERTNDTWSNLDDRMMVSSHPPENRPVGRPVRTSSGPGPVRPARLPRPRFR